MESRKIPLDGLSGKPLDFAELHNAMINAGYTESFAASTAIQVVSGGFNINCNCKN
jgi:hypothetical protein